MRKTLFGIVALCGLLGLGLVGNAIANSAVDGDAPAMMASPQMIVLAKVGDITVHTNIPYGTVFPGSVELNNVAASGVWADDCGHLVARFAVKALGLTPGEATLTLTGLFRTGATFSATDEVRVK